MDFTFRQVDVFTAEPLKGNPLAVVADADTLTDAQMAALANWTNLSETAFLLKPVLPEADYRVRIFTPRKELPFAGHPTLGAAYVWRALGGQAKGAEIIQDCGIGAVRVREAGGRFSFAAPDAMQSEIAPEILTQIMQALGISPADVVTARQVSTSPPWMAVMLKDQARVLALEPDFTAMGALEIGVVAPAGGEVDFEVRAFAPADGIPEDPVTGSLNAGLARWMISAGLAPARYAAAQGTCLGRAGRVYVEQAGADIWVGGDVVTCVAGQISI